jgi:hypothetical protein
VPVQFAAIIMFLLGVTASAIVIERLTTPVLRLLEGYWPALLDPLRRRLIARVDQRARRADADWQQLAQVVLSPTANPNSDQLTAFARLDRARRRRPKQTNRYMPTRIGNILRAAETWPADKYGLDAVVVWPRLWLVVPDTTREQLTAARTALDASVAVVMWGLLFCAFSVWTLLAIPVGLVIASAAVTVWVPARAEVFGDLVEAAYDLHRTALYQQLRWPAPTSAEHERNDGERLSSYLWRGSDAPEPTFTPPP